MKVKEESEKAGLKLNIRKTKIMKSGPITSWQIDQEKNGSSDRFFFFLIFLGSKITAMTVVMKLILISPWKKSYDKPRLRIKKQTITLPTKVHIVKTKVFPVVMHG